MSDNLNSEANNIDAFLDALSRNINATAPDDLDNDTADFLRELVQAQAQTDDEATKKRVWQHALMEAQSTNSVMPSINGHMNDPMHSNISPEDEIEQDTNMTTYINGNQLTRRTSISLTLAVAATITLLFVSLLVTFERYSSHNAPIVALQPTEETPVDMMAMFDRYINEVLIGGDMDVLDEILTRDHILYGRFGQDTVVGLRQTKALLETWFHLVTDVTLQDVIVDEDSVWARVEMSQTIQSTIAHDPNAHLILYGVMLVYLDESERLFDETYFFLIQGNLQYAEVDPYDVPGNTEIVQTIFDNFWNASAENTENPAINIADLYAPDFQLHLENNNGVTLQANEELPVTEVLNTAHATLLTAFPNLSIQQINVTASGNYVFVNIEVQTGLGDTIQTINGVLSYRFVNGLISEERWTSEQDIFLSASAD